MLESCRKDIPELGLGVALYNSHLDGILEERPQPGQKFDWVEIIPESYMERRTWDVLDKLTEKGFSLISHGKWLSIGGMDPLDETYLKGLKRLLQYTQPPWFSDHLCFSGIDDTALFGFMPLPRTRETVRHIVPRIRAVQERMELPFLMEPFFSYIEEGIQELTETQFISEISEQADCGLLLDAKVVRFNTLGKGHDPIEFLEQLPLDRVIQVHMAGYRYPTPEADRELHQVLAEILRRTQPCGILLEQGLKVADFDEVMSVLPGVWELVDRVGIFGKIFGNPEKEKAA